MSIYSGYFFNNIQYEFLYNKNFMYDIIYLYLNDYFILHKRKDNYNYIKNKLITKDILV